MKIFSEMLSDDNKPVFALYLDKQQTGDPAKDCLYCANDFSAFVDCNDPEKILNLLIPMISELVYIAYGESAQKTEPLTNWHATGFDPNFPNGVKI